VHNETLSVAAIGVGSFGGFFLFRWRFPHIVDADPQSQRPNDVALSLCVAPRGAEVVGDFVQGITLVRRDVTLRCGP
jgi:hypothetical protein